MKSINTSKGKGLSKTNLLQEFWEFRAFFLLRIRRIIFNQDIAEDVFQDACVKFLLSPAVFKYPGKATRYFCLILRSQALQRIRQNRWLEYRSELPEMVRETESEYHHNLMLSRISDAVTKLPAKESNLLSIYFRPELSLSEKCEALHLPRNTMRYQAGIAIRHVSKMVISKSKGFAGNQQGQVQ